MRKKLISPSLQLFIIGIFLVPGNTSPSSSSSWDVKARSRRQAAVAPPASDAESTTPSPDPTAEPQANCEALEELKSKCKKESCPKDDITIGKCCSCLQTCCGSEKQASTPKEEVVALGKENTTEANSGSEFNTTNTNTTASTPVADTKSKISEAAGKVGGFFKNVGQSIKQGVDSGWDKVKSTANNVKESVRKGVNTGADWVRNKTIGGDNQDNKKDASNCTSPKDSNCTSDMDDDDVVNAEDISGSTNYSKTDEKESVSKKTKRSPPRKSDEEERDSSSKYKNKVKISLNPNTGNNEESDESESTTKSSYSKVKSQKKQENDSDEDDSSSKSETSSKLRSAQEKGDNRDSSSSNKGSTATNSNMNNNSTSNNGTNSTTRKPVPGMHKSRKRRQGQGSGSYNYRNESWTGSVSGGGTVPDGNNNQPPNLSSSGVGTGPGYGHGSYSGSVQGIQGNSNTTTITSESVSSGAMGNGRYRKRRDVPPGMMAERSKRMKEEQERKKNETGTTNSIPEIDVESGRRSRRSPVGDENEWKATTMMTPSMSMSTSSTKIKVKREPAGPPSNSQNMRTTTATPAPPMSKNDNDSAREGRRKRASNPNKKTTKSPIVTSTLDPLGGDDTNSSTPTSASSEESSTKPSSTPGKGTKVWITVSSNNVKTAVLPPNNQAGARDLVPIRASGSVVIPDDISHRNDKFGNGPISSLPLDNPVMGLLRPQPRPRPQFDISPAALLSEGANGPTVGAHAEALSPLPLPPTHSSGPASEMTQSKPGRCRPLSQGLQCVSLGRDAAQCKEDASCEGSKKCCFYSCKPNSDIGVCDLPIFS